MPRPEQAFQNIDCRSLTNEQWRRIAARIDNSYMPEGLRIEVKRIASTSISVGYFQVNGGKTGSIIRFFSESGIGIEHIDVLGEWTTGFEEIHEETYSRVAEFIQYHPNA